MMMMMIVLKCLFIIWEGKRTGKMVLFCPEIGIKKIEFLLEEITKKNRQDSIPGWCWCDHFDDDDDDGWAEAGSPQLKQDNEWNF